MDKISIGVVSKHFYVGVGPVPVHCRATPSNANKQTRCAFKRKVKHMPTVRTAYANYTCGNCQPYVRHMPTIRTTYANNTYDICQQYGWHMFHIDKWGFDAKRKTLYDELCGLLFRSRAYISFALFSLPPRRVGVGLITPVRALRRWSWVLFRAWAWRNRRFGWLCL